jgi:integrase
MAKDPRKIKRIGPGHIVINGVHYSDLAIPKGRDPKTGKVIYRRLRRALSTDRRIAETKLADLVKAKHATKHGHTLVDHSYAGLKERFFKIYNTKSKITRRHYERAFRSLEGEFPISDAKQITPDLLTEVYTRWKQGTGRVKGKTTAVRGLYVRNRDTENIIAFMRKAEAWGALPVQDWEPVLGLMDKEPRGRIDFFTPEEIGTLKAKTFGIWHTMTLLGARAGLRPGEMFHLQKTDLDFRQNKIHIDSKPKLNWFIKNYERRTIPMAHDLRSHLWDVFQKTPGDFILADEHGDRPASTDVMSTYYSRRVRAAGLKGHLYRLRHTFGSHLAQAGRRLDEIRDLLGHKNVATTEIYTHLLPEMHKAAVEALPDIPAPKQKDRAQLGHKVVHGPS